MFLELQLLVNKNALVFSLVHLFQLLPLFKAVHK
jgi:hypothetical protein